MRALTILLLLLTLAVPAGAGELYGPRRIADGVFALLARPGTEATANALLVAGDHGAVIVGEHFTARSIEGLFQATAEVTDQPVRQMVLVHHHRGYTHVDFDFPPGIEVITGWQSWQALASEARQVDFPVFFFREGLTLRLGGRTLVLSNLGPAHTNGDLVAFIPETKTLYCGDLFYPASVGYLAEGFMQEWVLALEFLQSLEANRVVAGTGPVSDGRALAEFTTFFRAFLTEVIRHLEAGHSLRQTLNDFRMAEWRHRQDYDRYMAANIEHAYNQLKNSISPKK
ncbi:MAG: MBL fold metallo-hydrolase [Geothermobacteraceae bacterium]